MNFESFQLSEHKGDAFSFELSMHKDESFTMKMLWDGKADIDIHALVTENKGDGRGGKMRTPMDILSTYNVKRTVFGRSTGLLEPASDKTFSIHDGALSHSPDALDGNKDDVDEYIVMKPAKLNVPNGSALEIILLTTIHEPNGKTFGDIQNARVVVENSSGVVLAEIKITEAFASNTGIQVGSIIIDQNGANFHSLGVGFNLNFNEVMKHFIPS